MRIRCGFESSAYFSAVEVGHFRAGRVVVLRSISREKSDGQVADQFLGS